MLSNKNFVSFIGQDSALSDKKFKIFQSDDYFLPWPSSLSSDLLSSFISFLNCSVPSEKFTQFN